MWMITECVRPAATVEKMFYMFQRSLNLVNLTQAFYTLLIKISITQTSIHKILHQGMNLEI